MTFQMLRCKQCRVERGVQITGVYIFPLLYNLRPEAANAEFSGWKAWVGTNCTWLYIGSQVSKLNLKTARWKPFSDVSPHEEDIA